MDSFASLPDAKKGTLFADEPESGVRNKVKKAFCEEGVVEGNPILSAVEQLVLPALGKLVAKARPGEDDENQEGTMVDYTTMAPLQRAFAAGEVPAAELKAALTASIETIISWHRAILQREDVAKSVAVLQAKFQKKTKKDAKARNPMVTFADAKRDDAIAALRQEAGDDALQPPEAAIKKTLREWFTALSKEEKLAFCQ